MLPADATSPEHDLLTAQAWPQSGKNIQKSVKTKKHDFRPRLSSYMAVYFNLKEVFQNSGTARVLFEIPVDSEQRSRESLIKWPMFRLRATYVVPSGSFFKSISSNLTPLLGQFSQISKCRPTALKEQCLILSLRRSSISFSCFSELPLSYQRHSQLTSTSSACSMEASTGMAGLKSPEYSPCRFKIQIVRGRDACH